MRMKVLIACEESQAVCVEFRKLGFEAYSCDVLPCSGGHSEWHIQDNVMNVLRHDIISPFTTEWDMVIAFPPCTDLAVSGAKWLEQKRKDGRQQKSIQFFEFFTYLKNEFVCIENPIGIMSTKYRKPDQIIQPWMFGDPFTKPTCLWLKGLPLLKPTNIVEKGSRHITKSGKSLPSWYNLPPSEDRSKLRSRTFPGIAKAMAEQWSNLSK